MTVAMSGYAMAGYPKAIPEELVKRKTNGEPLAINLITGANVPWLDDVLGSPEIIAGRAPMVASRTLSALANAGKIRYVEEQMSKMARLLRSQSFGEIDVLVVEALEISKDGLVPTTSVGFTNYLLDAANEIIVEINTAQPDILMGLHDIYIPKPAPATEPIPLKSCKDRIGSTFLPVNPSKIKAIVETDKPENTVELTSCTDEARKIAAYLFSFLREEYHTGSGGLLPPIQLGFGNIANAIAELFQSSEFSKLQFHCGGVSEQILELVQNGKACAISTGAITMNENAARILGQIPDLHQKLILRNGELMNNAEVVGRLGVAALNTGIEIDIYGNVNSSHIAGTRVVNGIGGGANFAQNAGLSAVLIPSMSKGGRISNIVPMVSHQDICEHDIDIVISENGLADVRGLDDLERAEAIIQNCAAEAYRQPLFDYFTAAKKLGGHHPQNPQEAFAWHTRLKETGTMHEK